MTMTEPSKPRGTLRRGSRLSSASGATASHPLKAKIEKTTAKKSEPDAGTFAGSKGAKLRPPGPGLASPCAASATMMTTSLRPVTTSTRSEARTPMYAVAATSPNPPAVQTHTGMFTPYSASTTGVSTVLARYEKTSAGANGSQRVMYQPAKKPARG